MVLKRYALLLASGVKSICPLAVSGVETLCPLAVSGVITLCHLSLTMSRHCLKKDAFVIVFVKRLTFTLAVSKQLGSFQ